MNVIETVIAGVIILIGIAGAYLITKIAGYWSAKKDDIVSAIVTSTGFSNNEFATYLLKHVANVVDDVVAAMNTKFKPELLEKTGDGKLTKEDGVVLRDKALELIMKELPASVWDELADVVDDSEEYVKTLIEKSVESQKDGIATLESTIETTQDLSEITSSED